MSRVGYTDSLTATELKSLFSHTRNLVTPTGRNAALLRMRITPRRRPIAVTWKRNEPPKQPTKRKVGSQTGEPCMQKNASAALCAPVVFTKQAAVVAQCGLLIPASRFANREVGTVLLSSAHTAKDTSVKNEKTRGARKRSHFRRYPQLTRGGGHSAREHYIGRRRRCSTDRAHRHDETNNVGDWGSVL